MSEARGRSEWACFSSIMALLVNMFRDPKKTKVISPNEFNPYMEKKSKNKVTVPVNLLKDLWVKGKDGGDRQQH